MWDSAPAKPSQEEEIAQAFLESSLTVSRFATAEGERHLGHGIQATPLRIPAGQSEITSALHRLPQLRQQLRRMLQVSVNHTHNLSIAMLPAVDDRSSQTARIGTH